ncbi:MAG: glucose-6-phosphate isomerase [Bacteroidales bacterium]|nr:glucose-6-phosphate isomerase [Bacteroidales bacterium]
MTQLKLNIKNLENFVKHEEIDAILPEVVAAQDILNNANGKGNDFLGWVTLPNEIDESLLASIKRDAEEIASKAQIYVVIGIGGSYLGARAVIEALQTDLDVLDKSRKNPYIIYAGHTLSEDYYSQLLNVLNNYDYALTVISKSGTTTEPAVAFRILKNHIENKYGKEEAKSRIIAITDQRKGALHDIAVKEGYKMYVIPDNVGGRYSVLTPVGLLPIAVAGYDIKKLVKGACEMKAICIQHSSVMDNPALLYAAVRNILYRKGKNIEMMVIYEPSLKYIAEWWKQLYGESEGKDGKGILPHSVTFTTDLHSMGQYIQDGERIMFETVLNVKHSNTNVNIPYDEEDADGLNYLQQRTITEINHAAVEGTTLAHVSGGVPVMKIEMPKIDETILGELIYMMEYACGVSGYMLDVNPFDQLGVEEYKHNMFHILGKKGY